jgi:hypothetical protein
MALHSEVHLHELQSDTDNNFASELIFGDRFCALLLLHRLNLSAMEILFK